MGGRYSPTRQQLDAVGPDNAAVRRLAIFCLRNGSPQRDTVVLLQGIAEEDGTDRELRQTAAKVAATLDKRAKTRG